MNVGYTYREISDLTGFANGERFRNDAEVKDYFRAEVINDIFPDDKPIEQAALDTMAAAVIENGWHMTRRPEIIISRPGGL